LPLHLTPDRHCNISLNQIEMAMDTVLTTRGALLQALGTGPGYGRELMRRLLELAPGLVEPRPGTVYPALETLVRKGYVRRWTVVPGGRRGGRARAYYELTARGVAAAAKQKSSLVRLTTGRPVRPASGDEVLLMRDRLQRGCALSAFGLGLRRSVLRASGRSRG
jgi:DNA-binding PadR family transcriptional regulator